MPNPGRYYSSPHWPWILASDKPPKEGGWIYCPFRKNHYWNGRRQKVNKWDRREWEKEKSTQLLYRLSPGGGGKQGTLTPAAGRPTGEERGELKESARYKRQPTETHMESGRLMARGIYFADERRSGDKPTGSKESSVFLIFRGFYGRKTKKNGSLCLHP